MGLTCGNPLAFGYINKGNVVFDPPSGAGKYVFLAIQRGGDAGRAIGVDMTAEMVIRVRCNAEAFREQKGLASLDFRLGEIEHLPLAAILFGVSFGKASIRAGKADVAIRTVAGVALSATAPYLLATF